MSIEVNNESDSQVDDVALVELSRFVLDQMGVDPLAELSVLLVDTQAMTALHMQWMELPGPTDVMAFPMDGADDGMGTFAPDHGDQSRPGAIDQHKPMQAMLGDVVLCPEVAATQAAAAGHSTESELHLLTTHGILHLLGYDHGEADEEHAMFTRQAELLAAWTSHSGRASINAPVPGTDAQQRRWAHTEPS